MGVCRAYTREAEQLNKSHCSRHNFAARLGFEPRYSDSESEVLPLDDLAIAAHCSRNRGIFQLVGEFLQKEFHSNVLQNVRMTEIEKGK